MTHPEICPKQHQVDVGQTPTAGCWIGIGEPFIVTTCVLKINKKFQRTSYVVLMQTSLVTPYIRSNSLINSVSCSRMGIIRNIKWLKYIIQITQQRWY